MFRLAGRWARPRRKVAGPSRSGPAKCTCAQIFNPHCRFAPAAPAAPAHQKRPAERYRAGSPRDRPKVFACRPPAASSGSPLFPDYFRSSALRNIAQIRPLFKSRPAARTAARPAARPPHRQMGRPDFCCPAPLGAPDLGAPLADSPNWRARIGASGLRRRPVGRARLRRAGRIHLAASRLDLDLCAAGALCKVPVFLFSHRSASSSIWPAGSASNRTCVFAPGRKLRGICESNHWHAVCSWRGPAGATGTGPRRRI